MTKIRGLFRYFNFISILCAELFFHQDNFYLYLQFLLQVICVHNSLSWLHERRSRRLLKVQVRALMLFPILHPEVLILSKPGHTSSTFFSPNW
jgi:hypothetical protein